MQCIGCDYCKLNILNNDSNTSCIVYEVVYKCKKYDNKIIPIPTQEIDCELYLDAHYCNNCKHHKAILERKLYHRCDINGVIPDERLFTHRDCKDFIRKEEKNE